MSAADADASYHSVYSFFLAINILQFFSIFSTISPGLVILPLLIVLGITAVKDGYEDIKRHQSDRHVNLSKARVLTGGGFRNLNVMGAKSRSMTQVLHAMGIGKWGKRKSTKKADEHVAQPEVDLAERGGIENENDASTLHEGEFDEPRPSTSVHRPSMESRRSMTFHLSRHKDTNKPHWRKTTWEDIKVGDVVKITNEESFPADILICATSEEENVCYVETKNLDGETNLKSRNAISSLTHLHSADAFARDNTHFRIELDRPDVNMYKLNGAVVTDKGKEPLDLQTVLLRGTVLKNTSWVIGIVMFTGEDTKIVLNSGGTPSKRSKVERQMNPQV